MNLTGVIAIATACGVNVDALLPRPRAPKQPDPPEVIEARPPPREDGAAGGAEPEGEPMTRADKLRLEATTALTTCAWTHLQTEEESSGVRASRSVNGRLVDIIVDQVDHETWKAEIATRRHILGVGRAATALEAVLAAQRDAVHTLNELAHLCSASFGRVP